MLGLGLANCFVSASFVCLLAKSTGGGGREEDGGIMPQQRDVLRFGRASWPGSIPLYVYCPGACLSLGGCFVVPVKSVCVWLGRSAGPGYPALAAGTDFDFVPLCSLLNFDVILFPSVPFS